MYTSRLSMALAMGVFAASMATQSVVQQEPEQPTRNKRPTGRTYAPGGGARERARRLARMKKAA